MGIIPFFPPAIPKVAGFVVMMFFLSFDNFIK